MNSFGEFCAASEQPVPDESFVWHKRGGIVDDDLQPFEWESVLFLSGDTARVQVANTPGDLLLPDDNLTFSFDGKSPFKYRLQEVTTIRVDDDGEPVESQPTRDKKVIVSGASEAARATIDYFGLNGRHFESEQMQFSVPIAEYERGIDRRVEQRTRVWFHALELASLFNGPNGFRRSVLDLLVEQGRRLVAATGYWST